jgi:hypothetical protein
MSALRSWLDRDQAVDEPERAVADNEDERGTTTARRIGERIEEARVRR